MDSSSPHGYSKCWNGTPGLYHSNPTSPSPQIYPFSIPLSIEPEHLTQDSKALPVWHLSTFQFFLKPTSRCSVLGSLLQLVPLPGVTLLLIPKASAGLSDFSFHISHSKKPSLINSVHRGLPLSVCTGGFFFMAQAHGTNLCLVHLCAPLSQSCYLPRDVKP